MIVSFGYANGPAPDVGRVFDVRELTHDTKSPAFLSQLQTIIEHGRANPNDVIAIGCEHGKHRSVVLASKSASALRRSLYHRDRGKR